MRGKYDQERRQNIDSLEKDLSRFLEDLKGGFQPLEMNLEVGAGSDLDGSLLQPSSFQMTLADDEFDENRRQWVKGGPSGGSEEQVSESDDILDLLIQDQVTQKPYHIQYLVARMDPDTPQGTVWDISQMLSYMLPYIANIVQPIVRMLPGNVEWE